MSLALRWTRALLLAGVALSTGTLAHASARGLLPGPVAMVVLLGLGTALCAPLLGRPAARARIVLLVVLGQSLVHVVLTALADLTGPHALMAVAHVAAAALVGLWLASGEQALAALLQLAKPRTLPELRLPSPLPRVTTGWRWRTATPRLWHTCIAGRGPPLSFS